MKSSLSRDLSMSEEGRAPGRRLRTRLGRLIEEIFGPEFSEVWAGLAEGSPELDVCEEDGRLVVCAEMPGVAPGDLEVSVSGRTLTIQGERRSERSAGSYRRTITLPEDVDPESAKSDYAHGVLTLSFEKKAEAKAAEKRIPVGAAPAEAPEGGGERSDRRLKEVMTRTVECAKPDDPVQDVAARMKNLDLGSFPVCDDQGRVVGMITDRDLVVRVMAEGRDPWTARVRDVMTREVATADEDGSVASAEKLMKEKQIRGIPVVDRDRRLAGYFSIGRLARTDAAESREVLKRVTEPPKSKSA